MKKKAKETLKSKSDYGTILIAEDEDLNFMILEIFLLEKLKLPCKILHAKNGLEAVEYCEKDEDIKLVLMDIKMPVMNGFEATKKIKKLRDDLPIIAQSAYSNREDKLIAIEAGCDDFISKPIDYEKLRIGIDKCSIDFSLT